MNTTDKSTDNPYPEHQTQFTLQIAMLSDWHIGSGTGRRGEIDRLVKRDRDGLPYIPAKTLIGIWRDACELAADGLDEGQPHGFFSQLVDCIFGDQPALATEAIAESPCQAALSVRAAHLPEALRTALKNKPLLREAVAFVKPGIKIDPQTGCAIEDCLRFEEVVRGGITLTSGCSLNLSGDLDLQKLAFALLVVSTRLIEKIGGKRRRGSGKCGATVVGVDVDVWVAWLAERLNSNLPKISRSNSEDDRAKAESNGSAGEVWETIRLQIDALSPIVIPQRTVGNVVETLDYIPGTHLLKIFCGKLAQLININEAIACNDIIVTNATIAIAGQPGRPTPLMLFGQKLGGGLSKGATIYNRFVEDANSDVQLKGERGGYLVFTSESQYPDYAKVNCIAETHNIVEDAVQRPTENTGGAYTYEAIAAGTIFLAEVRLRKSLADRIATSPEKWQTILDGEASLGQSKKDDYGRIRITVLPGSEANAQSTATQAQTLTVWLLSDVLLRDKRLRPTTDLSYLKTELEKQLEINLELPREKVGITRSHRTESWQVRWQRPRPSLVGIAAGSCIRFAIPNGSSLNKEKLNVVEQSGIGERRVEGYGQVCFNHPLLSTKLSGLNREGNASSVEDSMDSNNSSEIAGNMPEYPYARIIERAAWRKAIQQKVLALTATPEERKELLGIDKDKPTMSQLGALRSILSRIKSFDDGKKAIDWLNDLKGKDNRREKWHQDSLDKIHKYLRDGDHIWQEDVLKLEFSELTLTETGKTSLKQELWAEALFTLIDGCIRAHKRSLENTDNKSENIIDGGDRNGA
jgi:CRISPR-associated protein Csx10